MNEFLQTLLAEKQVKPNDQLCISRMFEKLTATNNSTFDQLFNLNIKQLSQLVCTSERNLRRKCQRLFGMSPNDLLTTYRIQNAKLLLAQNHNISDVAFALGFTTHSHFSTVFKKITGMSPKEYKAQ